MSSGGLLFHCGAILPAGELLYGEIIWPQWLDEQPRLHLSVHGFIVRSSISGTAIRLTKYQFRPAITPLARLK